MLILLGLTHLFEVGAEWLLTKNMQTFLDATKSLSGVNISASGDPDRLKARMLQHLFKRGVCSDAEFLVLRILFRPGNLMRSVTANCDHIDPCHSVEKSVDMSLAHAPETDNSNVETRRGHYGKFEYSEIRCKYVNESKTNFLSILLLGGWSLLKVSRKTIWRGVGVQHEKSHLVPDRLCGSKRQIQILGC